MRTTRTIVEKYIEFCNKKNIQIQTHQIYGVLWCIRKERELIVTNKWKGGILADDMGMGKTIQMIATITLHFKNKTLIILPPILIPQWHSEILKILGHSAIIYHGKNKNHLVLKKAIVVITSYDTFLRSPELLEISWNRTICDEAHRLRNPKTKVYTCIQQLQTDILWCITGTPIHNKIRDIMSLFALFTITGKCNYNSSASSDLEKMILRRTKLKSNILLPEKKEFKQLIPWTNLGEWDLAKDIHSSINNAVSEDTNTSFWKTKNMNDLVTMIRAKQLCILPKLMEKTVQQLELDEPDDLFPDDFKHTTFQNASCKLNAILQHILCPTRQGRGKIIFCHFQLEMTKIIELLREKENNYNYWIGNWKDFTKRQQRQCKKTPILILQIIS